eukprot:9898366-Heterocapsa_arctica.AAC.1
MDQALMIRSWILTLDANSMAKQIQVQDDKSLKAPEMEHTEFGRKVHKQCYDALTNGMQGNLQEKQAMDNKFDVVENSRFGW